MHIISSVSMCFENCVFHFLFLTFFQISLLFICFLDGGFWGGVYLSLIVIFSITVDFSSVIESMNFIIIYVREYSVIFILLGLGSAIKVDSFTHQATLNRDQGEKKK